MGPSSYLVEPNFQEGKEDTRPTASELRISS